MFFKMGEIIEGWREGCVKEGKMVMSCNFFELVGGDGF